MMQRERLQLALERIRPEQWKLFEEFAYDGKVRIVLQYSVTKEWASKIRATAQKIPKNIPSARVLIYVTNKSIISAADSLKRKLLDEYELVLDVHDSAWFLDRISGNEDREVAAEALAEKIVDPYLKSKGVLEHTAPTFKLRSRFYNCSGKMTHVRKD